MNFYTDNHPIIACSTGTSTNTAIAVIRLSGFADILSLQPFFSFNLSKIKFRYSHLTNIIFESHIFDNVLMVFFPEGESYTGENILEISVHGNLLNIQLILDLFTARSDFRIAHPGEFTYRALKNKKLSLSQVEGLDMLLNANSSLMLSQGLDILQGELHAQYIHLYDNFLKLKAAIEISIDFSEDIGDKESKELFFAAFNSFMKLLESLYARTQGNISSLLSPEIVLIGQTNAGKSSLFNLLVKHNRSIVSSIAGTTRDYISEIIHIDGTNYTLVDTAGIRESNDIIENIGIGRAFEILNRAFFKVLIINPFETNQKYLDQFSNVKFDLLIISHSDKPFFQREVSLFDLSKIFTSEIASASFTTGSIGPMDLKIFKKPPTLFERGEAGSIEPAQKIGPIEPAQKIGPIEPVQKIGPIEPVQKISPIEPVQKIGPIEPMVKKLLVNKFKIESANNPILLERHRNCISALYIKSLELHNKINIIDDVAILSSEINIFAHYLSELIGIVSPEDVLNSIFSNFCIGK